MTSGKIIFELEANESSLAVYDLAMKLSKHPVSQVSDVVALIESYFQNETDCVLGNPYPIFSKAAVRASISEDIKPLFTTGIFAPGGLND